MQEVTLAVHQVILEVQVLAAVLLQGQVTWVMMVAVAQQAAMAAQAVVSTTQQQLLLVDGVAVQDVLVVVVVVDVAVGARLEEHLLAVEVVGVGLVPVAVVVVLPVAAVVLAVVLRHLLAVAVVRVVSEEALDILEEDSAEGQLQELQLLEALLAAVPMHPPFHHNLQAQRQHHRQLRHQPRLDHRHCFESEQALRPGTMKRLWPVYVRRMRQVLS